MSGAIAYYHHILNEYQKRFLQPTRWDKRLGMYREWLYSRQTKVE